MSGKTTAIKKGDIEKMFNSIAPGYDRANTLLSFGTDRRWRKKVIRALRPGHPAKIADIATGTGKLAAMLSSKLKAEVYGIDISENMLEIARKKYKGIQFICADGETLPFPENSFDALTIAFGIRNFENPVTGLKEACRVIKPGGMIAVLEFSKPSKNLFGKLFRFYFRHVIPLIGKVITGNGKAYRYLNQSALTFISGSEFLELLGETGFTGSTQQRLTGGVATLYTAIKK